MGRTKGPYEAEYPKGSLVRVASHAELESFQRDWKHHNPLTDRQLDFAGSEARVADVGFYHGGDELYQLEGVPGVWHEQCLIPVTRP